MEVSVALVQPTYAINVGYAARIMKNFGHKRLILVDAKFDRNEAMKFASHASDLLEKAEECRFDDLIKNEDYIVGTTAIGASRQTNLTRQAVPSWEIANAVSGRNICLVFGRDTTGLTNEEISKCDLLVMIQANRKYPTLNISHAIAIILYEISKSTFKQRTSASRENIDRITRGFAELALIAGVQQQKARLTEEALQRVLRRARPTEKEASLLIGLPRKVKLAFEKPEIVRLEKLKASSKEARRE
ncbi:MAG: RNA methyltransferase [Thaumarchaeota archaeon]|nr:RNA methyltransferase [Nitrososphaerota archaeon]